MYITKKYLNNDTTSQYNIDLYVHKVLFNEKPGAFVEVGANDPVVASNSYALENLGWKGIAFEPIEAICNKWPGIRSTRCYPYLIGDQEKLVDFIEVQGELSSISGVAGFGMREDYGSKPRTVIRKKKMMPLNKVVQELDFNQFDLLLLDVEGFELNVLKGIDFNLLPFRYAVIECFMSGKTARRSSKTIRRYMCQNGFRLLAHIGSDDVFINVNISNN